MPDRTHSDVLPTDEDLRTRIAEVLENSSGLTGRMNIADLAVRTGLSQQHVLELIHTCPLRGFKADGSVIRLRKLKES